MDLKSLLNGLQWKGELGRPRQNVTGIACHSDHVEKGFLFVAIPGTQQKGSTFVPEAVKRGAAAIVTDEPVEVPSGVERILVQNPRHALAQTARNFYGDPTQKLSLIGVTGTNGKTTTTYLLQSILETAGKKTGMVGTIRYFLGSREIPARATTPDALELMSYLREMLEEGVTHAVLEVSSHALDQGRVDPEDFEVAAFTNLTRDHLDYHHSMEEYREAKATLFRELPTGSTAVLNRDDKTYSYLCKSTRARVISYGIDSPGEICATEKRVSSSGLVFLLHYGDEKIEVTSSLVGNHNLYNILTAAGCCQALGLSLEEVVEGISALKGVPGRMEHLGDWGGVRVIVDYAHTDDALKNLLSNVRPLVSGRLITIFGCGGDRDRGKRPRMGAATEALSDVQWVTSDNPRTEDPEEIIEEILQGFKHPDQAHVEPDRGTAIRKAIAGAQPGDLVVIAGKGHEDYQIIGKTKRHFSDREVATAVLTERMQNTRENRLR